MLVILDVRTIVGTVMPKKMAIRFNRKTEESWKIMEINQKKVEKTLRKVALNEFKVKRPQNVKLLRMKSTQIFTKGTILKILSVSQILNPYYAIVEQHQDKAFVLLYSRNGDRQGGKEIDLTKGQLKWIKKHTKKIFEYPK